MAQATETKKRGKAKETGTAGRDDLLRAATATR
jgi:hypothetical protein